ncbi:MAG TPA: hypothetical protein H9942_10370 [Candidatus Acutalibacter ornithocaccae]|uniref:Mannosyltransferase (PIG-V) n=1 Tax=Candidatus Acutalibacter ornithocaccae TaxID=2838416 RepID=A0A9D2RZE9_9FIRM|nr:hypothetical protein [Candidatus Acutalibacter ornithocaccae]
MAGVVVSLAVCLLGLLVVYRCLAAWGLRAPGSLARHAVEEGPPAAQGLQPGWKIFLLGAGSRVGLLLVGMAAAMLLSDGGLTWEGAFQQLQRWDAAHYIHLIEEGYQGYTENGQHLFLVFFPGYVWAARLLRLAIPSTALAGMALSCLCYGGACCYLYRLAGEAYNGRVARDALLYMSLFPFSFFSGPVMTEGLFLLATTGACWYAWRGKWLAFGLFGALAALTRMTGLLVIAVGVIRLLEAYRPLEPPVGKSLGRCWKPLLLRLPLTLLPAAGTLLYLLLNLWVDGDPFAFASHQEHWHQGYLWISQVVEYIGRYLWDNLGSSFGWAVWAPALALFVGGLALLYWAALRRGHPAGLLAYGFCFFVATYSLSWLLSAGRYLSTCFVLFLFLAKLTQRRPALRAALLGGEGVLLGVYLCAFLAGAQVM